MTVVVILGGGVQGGVEVEVEVKGSSPFFGFGAKKREITCCFGFPIYLNVTVVDRRDDGGGSDGGVWAVRSAKAAWFCSITGLLPRYVYQRFYYVDYVEE